MCQIETSHSFKLWHPESTVVLFIKENYISIISLLKTLNNLLNYLIKGIFYFAFKLINIDSNKLFFKGLLKLPKFYSCAYLGNETWEPGVETYKPKRTRLIRGSPLSSSTIYQRRTGLPSLYKEKFSYWPTRNSVFFII